MQSTLARRLYQVSVIKVPGVYVSELLDSISAKPLDALVVELCHLYSSVPSCPFGRVVLVMATGAVPVQMV